MIQKVCDHLRWHLAPKRWDHPYLNFCSVKCLLFLLESHLNEVQHAGPLAEDDNLLLGAHPGGAGGGAAGGAPQHCCQPHVRLATAPKGTAAHAATAAATAWGPPVKAIHSGLTEFMIS